MRGKKRRNAHSSGIQVTPVTTATDNITLETIPDTAPLTNDGGTNRAATIQKDEHELEKRYKTLNQRLQVFSLVIAALAIALTVWNIKLQYSNKRLQSDQSAFEKNQRVVELTVSLGSYWEERLDRDTRYRATRFIKVLDSLKSSPDEQKEFLTAFLDDKNLLHADLIKSNKTLSDLVDPAYSPDTARGMVANRSVELSKYRFDLVKVMNTMEMIAIVMQHTTESGAVEVLKAAYASSIKQRYRNLLPFIKAYREKYKDERKVDAWVPLDPLGNAPDE